FWVLMGNDDTIQEILSIQYSFILQMWHFKD
ncbi:hypothetical protein HG1285_09726, partial [Hydrogenivirga sp. 128-5-R1-1]